MKHALAVTVEPFKFSPAEPVAYELSYWLEIIKVIWLDIFFNMLLFPKYKDFVIWFAIGLDYFDKPAAPVIDQDAGYRYNLRAIAL